MRRLPAFVYGQRVKWCIVEGFDQTGVVTHYNRATGKYSIELDDGTTVSWVHEEDLSAI